MNNSNKETLISGRTLASTLKIVSNLGEIGKKLMNSAGVNQIDIDKWYPYRLRIQMLDLIHDRFGSEALFVFGLNTIFYQREIINEVKKLRKMYDDSISLDNSDNNVYLALWKVNEISNQNLDTNVRNNTRGQHELYGAEIHKNSANNFTYKTKYAIGEKHEAFARGGLLAGLSLILADEWRIKIINKSSTHQSDLDLTTFDFDCIFEKFKSEKNLPELLIDLQIDARDVLMHKVVLDSDNSLRKLDDSHKIIVESVNYASRLQRGQLPRQSRIDGRFASFASIWEPRDTIGGDLYWLSSSQQSGPFVLAVADCTGHGVPGAMLSLLVSNSLERIYANDTAEDPATALMSLDHYVRTGLNQDRADSESDDGCDAAVLRIDRDKQTIEFAGAKLGLFQVTPNGVLIRHLGSRCSLGYQDTVLEADKPVVHKIPYQSGDVFAVVTDGFTDQIGGAMGKTSFGYRRLEEILKANCTKTAEEITAAMKSDFAAWQDTNARRDDMTAVVFRL